MRTKYGDISRADFQALYPWCIVNKLRGKCKGVSFNESHLCSTVGTTNTCSGHVASVFFEALSKL